ncbi:MAG: transposase, partial [Pseudomonadota bacterium]
RLMPDFKTDANLRKENARALRGVCREFVVLYRNLDLLSDALVAIDSSKFKAVNNRDRNFTVAKMKRRLEQIEKSIDRYLAMMDTAVRQEPEIAEAQNARLGEMATCAKETTGADDLTVEADRGYFGGEQVRACDDASITTFVPRPLRSGSKAKGRFAKQDFIYLPDENAYRCPAGEKLTWRYESVEGDKTMHSYWTTACAECPVKEQGTTGKEHRIKRWEHDAVVEAAQRRLDLDPGKMAVRRCTAEHPFGTLKSWMGGAHFLTRMKDKINAEMSLFVLAYKIKRMIKILGIKPLLETIRAHVGAWNALLTAVTALIDASKLINDTNHLLTKNTEKVQPETVF